jgi:pyridoxamine 5'-phosphate oxidase
MAERDLASWRAEYAAHGLDVDDLPADPIVAFVGWLDAAREAGLHEPNAMVVSTTGSDGQPSARLVLLKSVGAAGFTFYTNYGSRKAAELAADDHCALLFPWHALQRQVRVEGRARRVDAAESDAYFAGRPRESQLGAWASEQSAVVSGRHALERSLAEVTRRFEGRAVPRPDFWGGYRVAADVIEFWQGRFGRMHDRLRFTRAEPGWDVDRLAP